MSDTTPILDSSGDPVGERSAERADTGAAAEAQDGGHQRVSADKRPRKEGRVWSEVEVKSSGEIVSKRSGEERLDDEAVYGPDVRSMDIAYPSVELSRTYNLGNYESVRVKYGVTLPCHLGELEEGFRVARELARTRLVAELEQIKAAHDGDADSSGRDANEPTY